MPRFLVLGLMLATACASESSPSLIEGGLYSTQNEEGTFSIVKVLKLDDGGVHVRVYSDMFAARPTTLDESTLYMVGVKRGPSEGLGIGHLPLSKSSFAGWRPTFIKTVEVKEEELEGYRMWLDAKGGYF
jgi:hypothetical protein